MMMMYEYRLDSKNREEKDVTESMSEGGDRLELPRLDECAVATVKTKKKKKKLGEHFEETNKREPTSVPGKFSTSKTCRAGCSATEATGRIDQKGISRRQVCTLVCSIRPRGKCHTLPLPETRRRNSWDKTQKLSTEETRPSHASLGHGFLHQATGVQLFQDLRYVLTI